MIVEILVEEPSMEECLKIILPKLLPDGFELGSNVFIRPHQGKQHLQKSVPKKARAFSHYTEEVVLIVLQDQDSNDCIKLKHKLVELCKQGNCKHLVRIVCRELEAWYVGDMQAVEKVYPRFKASKYYKNRKFRNPDNCNAADELSKLIPQFQKGHASRNIPIHMDLDNNRSESFNQFKSGLARILSE